ncbi:MAG: hypothetical protein QS721_02720 [Candidatus Endonucleobacter sp. (ex Gigantidas childressi)]|nr:hypothetical protein [Candidatus Endonucleobacter sp. (ex Gigantidas childressi)]
MDLTNGTVSQGENQLQENAHASAQAAALFWANAPQNASGSFSTFNLHQRCVCMERQRI